MGILDWIAYGFPFASVIQYSLFNIENRFEYIVAPWYNYLVLLLAAFIFPTSLIFARGIVKHSKKIRTFYIEFIVFYFFAFCLCQQARKIYFTSNPFHTYFWSNRLARIQTDF